jgi:hypothetical protein
MTPLDAISKWLNEQDAEVRSDTGMLVSMLLFDNTSFEVLQNGAANLLAWLGTKGLPSYTVVGRAVRFRACFEFVYTKRFTPEGWTNTEKMFRSIISTGASDSTSDEAKLSPSAFPMLRALPERIEVWREVGIAWKQLLDDHISDEALESWQFRQPLRD